jgi:uncharacterized protein (UPF0261 family)
MIGILVLAEEKWEEANFLREQIRAQGHEGLIIDIGLVEEPQGHCDISRSEIIAASGVDSNEVASANRGKRMPIMIKGASKMATELRSEGTLKGLIGLGGTTGTQMGTDIMKSQPYGFPKLAVSSAANLLGFSNLAFGTSDITMMNTAIEFTGINNSLIQSLLARAAGAICGMVDMAQEIGGRKNGIRQVAITQMGICEICAASLRRMLEEKGYRVTGFVATGVGDQAMEEMISKEDFIDAVIDLTPGGLSEEMFDFGRKAGAHRLEAAGLKGIPQIVSLCTVNLGTPLSRNYRTRPELKERKKFEYDRRRTFIRLSEDELIRVADAMAAKLNMAKGPVTVVAPLGGWSSIDKRGTAFYDAALDKVFLDELKAKLKPEIKVKVADADLDSPEFAEAILEAFLEVMGTGQMFLPADPINQQSGSL